MPSLFKRYELSVAERLADGLQESLVRSRAALRESTQMSKTESSSLVAQEPSSFEVAVRDRSWDWLLELRRRLKVDLVLVDSRASVLLPALGDHAARLSSMLEHGEGPLVSMIATSIKERASQALDLHGQQISCVPVITDRHSGGALLVGRASPHRQDSGASRAQLELVASWLAAAVDAHLLSPPAIQSSGLNRVAPLAQLLGRASEHESDRELIRLFGEAIAVWHDIEVSGYVETTAGAFTRDVTLPGTRKGERPATIPPIGLPESTDLTRLPQGHLDRFGLPVNTDVYVRRFRGPDRRSWLLVFTGQIGAYDLQRIDAYCALLELTLSSATTSFIARIARAVGGRLAGVDTTPETQAMRALEELRTALGSAVATLQVESKTGIRRAQVTCPPEMSEGEFSAEAFRLVLVKRSERHYTTTVSLGRNESLQFTPRDHAAAAAATEMFGAWASAVFDDTHVHRERRASPRDFAELLQRSALEALDRGSPVTVVILLIHEAVSLRGSTQQWVAGIRGQLRASDLAGMLGEGEIGLLMHETGSDEAKDIAERLRAIVGGEPGDQSIFIGVASRTPGQGTVDSIVQDARADAVAGTRRRQRSDSPHGVNR
jgi:hypothetical protein